VTLDLYEGLYESALIRSSPEAIESLEPYDQVEIHLLAVLAHEGLGQGLEARRRAETSRSTLEKELESWPEDEFLRGRLSLTYAFLGLSEDAIKLGRSAAAGKADDAFSGPRFLEDLARIYLRNGQLDQAAETLEEVMSIPYHWAMGTTQLGLDPFWVPLGDMPRFETLLHANDRRREVGDV
jgi:tetratricopeptide (TPR) repeat protein